MGEYILCNFSFFLIFVVISAGNAANTSTQSMFAKICKRFPDNHVFCTQTTQPLPTSPQLFRKAIGPLKGATQAPRKVPANIKLRRQRNILSAKQAEMKNDVDAELYDDDYPEETIYETQPPTTKIPEPPASLAPAPNINLSNIGSSLLQTDNRQLATRRPEPQPTPGYRPNVANGRGQRDIDSRERNTYDQNRNGGADDDDNDDDDDDDEDNNYEGRLANMSRRSRLKWCRNNKSEYRRSCTAGLIKGPKLCRAYAKYCSFSNNIKHVPVQFGFSVNT